MLHLLKSGLEMRKICYSDKGNTRFDERIDEETFGQLYIAHIESFETKLHSEIEKIIIQEELVDNWTYPQIQPRLVEVTKRRGLLKNSNDMV